MLGDLAKAISNDIQSLVANANKGDAINPNQLQTLLQSALRKCNLVTREEFDAQAAVLQKTRAKLEALEAKIDQLTSQTPPNE